MGSRLLLVGMGGREHAVAWKLRQSPLVDEIFIAPGNAGTALLGTNLPVQPKDIEGLVRIAREHRIDFYLATMDDPQPLGLVDRLQAEGIVCYGPSQAAARLESSKAWAKQFMVDRRIPTAIAESFTTYSDARTYVESIPEQKLWVKASGLAAGKGAIGCNDLAEALNALDIVMVRRDFGSAGDTVVIEQDMPGWETSTHAFCDGKTARLMPPSTDYKRAQDGGIGLNTGGVGAYSPSRRVDDTLTERITREIVEPIMQGMRDIGAPYNGTLYPGIMVTTDGPKVVEVNARLGDPETQVLMPRLQSDLFEVCKAAAEGRLDQVEVRWSDDVAVGVVMASGGYPATYKLAYRIEGLGDVDPDVLVFHNGTKDDARGLVTNGGRVLTVVALAPTLEAARQKAYDNVGRITFADAQYRRDIALS
ncbi:MAG: phosphoribosylamine--glycine ligase [Anaerolineaceae bacterium]